MKIARLIRCFSSSTSKSPSTKISHETACSFLQIFENVTGVGRSNLKIDPHPSPARFFSATLTIPLSPEFQRYFQQRQLTVSGTGKSHVDAKYAARLVAVSELSEKLREQIPSLSSSLINKINEVELANITDDSIDEMDGKSQFDDVEIAANYLSNLHSRLSMSAPVPAAMQFGDNQIWKASMLGCLPKNITLSGRPECIRCVSSGKSKDDAKQAARIMYANKVFELLANPESYLPKAAQNGVDKEREEEEENTKYPTSMISFDSKQVDEISSFLDTFKESFNVPDSEIRQNMRNVLKSFKVPASKSNSTVASSVNADTLPKYPRADLPIHAHFQQIIQSISKNEITLITGATGSGKTTQLPQFIFNACKKLSSSNPYIVMTQPRRIAAIAAATRIAQEMGETIGKNSCIGYSVRFESVRPTHTTSGSLNVCTAGVLLKRLQNDQNLTGVTHLIIDEVHERDVTTDVLLLCLKQLLSNRNEPLKIIFMSATLVASKIAEYFSSEGFSVGCPFDISGTNYPVKVNYIENFHDFIALPKGKQALCIPPKLEKESTEFIENELSGSLRDLEQDIPYALILRLILHICLNEPLGSILIFLPGIEDLNIMRDLLMEQSLCDFKSSSPKCKLFLLHAGLGITNETSNELFVPATVPKPYRKVILATNVAESSVTVPDAVYVIDTAKHRVLKYDNTKRMSILETNWVSQANIKQRKGRAGRCRPGMYYFVGSEERFNSLPIDNPPEITRVNLESTCLTIRKIFPVTPLSTSFSELIDPPAMQSIRESVERLQTLQALNENEELCPLGDVMANFPVDPSYAKVLILGCLFKCLDPILTIVAATGERVFSIGISNYDRQTISKWVFWYASESKNQQHSFSDHLTLCSIVNEYEKISTEGERFSFCIERKLMYPSMKRIVATKRNFFKSLQQAGFIPSYSYSGYADPDLNLYSDNTHIIRTLLLMGAYPNVAFRMGYKKNHFKTKLLGYASIPSASGNCQLSESKYDQLKDTVDHEDFVEVKGPEYPQFWLFDSIMKTSFRPILNRITAISPLSLLLVISHSSLVPRSAFGAKELDRIVVDDWIVLESTRNHILLALGLNELLNRYIDWRIRCIIEGVNFTYEESNEFLNRLDLLVKSVFALDARQKTISNDVKSNQSLQNKN